MTRGESMQRIGCLARFFNPYKEEVEFSKVNGFGFMQLWYDRNGIAMKKDSDPIEAIKANEFPVIIHAVLDIIDFDEHVPKLKEILKKIGGDEIIVHPVSEFIPITIDSIVNLSEKIRYAYNEFNDIGVSMILENNSINDPIFCSVDDIKFIFEQNPQIDFLLDLAHIKDYDHLKEIIAVKTPKMLHLADKHFDSVHEHLPIGEGELDFEMIFKDILPNFDGRIILEIVQSSREIIESRDKIWDIIKK